MGEKPYLIDAVVGNGRMLATLGETAGCIAFGGADRFSQHVREMVAESVARAAEKVRLTGMNGRIASDMTAICPFSSPRRFNRSGP